MNLSTVSDNETASTSYDCAWQRAENMAALGATRVIELCVGPSLRNLEVAYEAHGIRVTGNDIDKRWQAYYPAGNWIIGNCFDISWKAFDAVVFAPPLSRGCTGKREDALSINEVQPNYYEFMRMPFSGIRCMVLPARSLATHWDRRELFDLIFDLVNPDIMPLTSGRRKTRKYVDIYWTT